MRRPGRRALRRVSTVLVLGAIAGSAAGGPSASRAPAAPPCPVAGRAEVVLPDGPAAIDGFRVVVGAARPGAATDVTVLAGGSDRTLRAFAPGELALLLDEPLRARRVQIALEPVLDAPAGACVQRVELLRGGAVVGTAVIE